LESLNKRDHSEDAVRSEMIISERILVKLGLEVWIGFIWPRIRTQQTVENTVMNLLVSYNSGIS
jgi:hypothetical protein